MIVLGITGLPGAGKGVFSTIASQLGIPVISMGDLVKEEVLKRGLEITPENVAQIAIKLREEHGPAAVALLVIKKIKENDLLRQSDVIVIDGIRSLDEVETLKTYFKNFILIAIHAPPSKRYERLLNRGRSDDSKNIDKIRERDLRELKFGVGNVIALADYILINDGSLKEFEEKTRKFLQEILTKYKRVKNDQGKDYR